MARSITKRSSKLSYLITRILVERDLADDCFRAYAYFRWADDVIDVSADSVEERLSFIRRQREIVDRLYGGDFPGDLSPEEEMVADLIRHDRRPNSGLQSFIQNFMDVLEFDAGRKGSYISQDELTWYSECLGRAVTDAIQYFVGNGQDYPTAENQYLAATAAHITHMLRDYSEDIEEGFINLPYEWLVSNGFTDDKQRLHSVDINGSIFKNWVREQVGLALENFCEGKEYLRELEVLRCKLAGFWYCARFECVLDAIERDNYSLRPAYNERRRKTIWLKTGWTTISLAFDHFIRKLKDRLHHGSWMKQPA
jgi:phytoene/squalene synthetase